MKNLLVLLFLISFVALANATEPRNSKSIYVTIGSDAIVKAEKSLMTPSLKVISKGNGISLVEIQESDLALVQHMMHEEMNRCAGFKRFDSIKEAQEELRTEEASKSMMKLIFADYSINQQDAVTNYIAQVDSINILRTIEKLSSFKNRYYMSKYGMDSQAWLKSKWESLVASRSDATVEYFQHSKWKQPSVILTLKGKSDDVIIVGGHADSISGYWRRSESRAPGADDNASGIATITEIIRVLIQNNFVPNKTIKFMGYAAEEVGLLGSKAIAKSFQAKNVNVIGVMQLDMTNYNGSALDIVMMSDFTNQAQNEFLGRIIDEYLPSISWGYDKCGYACSDHASWTGVGYPSSMPFEARMKEMNRKIHTPNDTLSVSRNSTAHAEKFAKLGVAFVAELDK